MADAILTELQEDFRRQQLLAWTRRYGPLVVVAALLLVFGTAGYVFYQRQQEGKLEGVTAQLYAGLGADAKAKPAEAAAKLDQFADAHADDRQAVLAQLLAAGMKQRANDRDGQLADLKRVLGNDRADAALRAAATMMYVQAALEADAPADLQKMLSPYQATDSAYRFTAWELGALVAHRAGDHAKAQQLLDQIIKDDGAPADSRNRAAELQRVL